MTWQTATSFIAACVVYFSAWRIETYFGWCGTPVANWLSNAMLVGVPGAAIAVVALVRIWRDPGVGAAMSRVIHMLLLVGFAFLLIRNFAYPLLRCWLN